MNEHPRTIGPCTILNPLGEGGMGIVYRARHRDHPDAIALKTVRLPREGLLQNIRREIFSLARLRHPGIVRIIDHGVESGIPWYAMELLEGTSLRERCRQMAGLFLPGVTHDDAGSAGVMTRSIPRFPDPSVVDDSNQPDSGPGEPASSDNQAAGRRFDFSNPIDVEIPVLSALALVRTLCSALSYLHGEGIVHRDLKPENILVRPDGLPVIVDFGLAAMTGVETSRESLGTGYGLSGTFAYMAPEQLRSELVDARADLYSLGCILFELLTGRPPFIGTAPRHFMNGHLYQAPPRPSFVRPGLPPELDDLLANLLAKNPAERIGYADDVAVMLGRLGAPDQPYPGAVASKPYLYRPGLFGRSAELNLLRQQLSGLSSHRGGLVIIAGESGVGKTRLALELSRLAMNDGLTVLTGSCPEWGAAPLETLRNPFQAIADRCLEQGELESMRLIGSRGPILEAYFLALENLPGQRELPPPGELPPDQARIRLFSSVAETLTRLAAEKPVLLVLDDFQWVDELSLEFLQFLNRGWFLRNNALLIVATCRVEEAAGSVIRLLDDPRVIRLELRRLDDESVAAVAGSMLAMGEIPGELETYLAGESNGNPFFVAEFLRAAIDESLLSRDSRGLWHLSGPRETADSKDRLLRLRFPGTIQALLERRLQGLDSPCRSVVEAAAVWQRPCRSELIQQSTGLADADFLAALSELLRRQILVEGNRGAVAFVHGRIRQVAYKGIAPVNRMARHRAVAEIIEALPENERSEFAADLGLHWESTGELDRARLRYLESARSAYRRFAHDESIRLFLAAMALMAQPSLELLETRLELVGGPCRHGSKHDLAWQQLTLALEESGLVQAEHRRPRIQLHFASVRHYQGKYAESIRLAEEAAAMAESAGDRPLVAQAIHLRATNEYYRGDLESARLWGERSLAMFDVAKAPFEWQNATMVLATIHREMGKFSLSRAYFQQTLDLARRQGYRSATAIALLNLAGLEMYENHHEQAEMLYQEALPIFQELQSHLFIGYTLHDWGAMCFATGKYDRATEHGRHALEKFRKCGDPNGVAVSIMLLGQIARDTGDLPAAMSHFQESLQLVDDMHNERLHASILMEIAVIDRWQGRVELAADKVTAAREIFNRMGDHPRFLAAIAQLGHCDLAWGRSAEARLAAIKIHQTDQRTTGLSDSLDRLQRAEAVFRQGRPDRLFQGELLEDLPPFLRQSIPRDGIGISSTDPSPSVRKE